MNGSLIVVNVADIGPLSIIMPTRQSQHWYSQGPLTLPHKYCPQTILLLLSHCSHTHTQRRYKRHVSSYFSIAFHHGRTTNIYHSSKQLNISLFYSFIINYNVFIGIVLSAEQRQFNNSGFRYIFPQTNAAASIDDDCNGYLASCQSN